MIEVTELTKRYGEKAAVDELSFAVRPGRVTGFLGPNGAGKSTTMRMILGLDRPTRGRATVNGREYDRWPRPAHVVGALLDAGAVHGGRSAFDHVYALARCNGIGRRRVSAVLAEVGLSEVARKRVGGFSLGMRQRLGIAVALLGDPGVLLFDEPVNGLDPEGIRWIRELMRALAAEGRTVLVSSHLMSEMSVTADHVLVLGKGKLIAEASMKELMSRTGQGVTVRSARQHDLASALRAEGGEVVEQPDGGLTVLGLDGPRVSEVAFSQGILLHELTPRGASLEEAYLRLTGDSVEYRTEKVAR